MIELHAIITGRVQGVRYRTFVEQAAMELGLVGSVRNLPNGSVYVIAQGLPEVLKSFVEYLHEGSLFANVEGVAVEWRSIESPLYEFSIIV